jgi:muramoyltetrapeptide carboxypeptidase LdcA involved in peptidoglycan recycling
MSKINNYRELMLEKVRLQGELNTQKAIMISEFDDIKKMFDPIAKGISIIKRIRKTVMMFTSLGSGSKAKMLLGRLLN